MKQSNETKQYFIYTDFDRRRIGMRENTMEWKVGDFTKIKNGQGEVMVYALVNLSENAEYVIKKIWHDLYRQNRCEKFYEMLNRVVEAVISITSDEPYCTRMRKYIEAGMFCRV